MGRAHEKGKQLRLLMGQGMSGWQAEGQNSRRTKHKRKRNSVVEAAAQKEAEQGRAVGDRQKNSGLDGDQGRMIWDVLWKKLAVSQ